jgi:fatty-acyl-CoA synthase/long-chain acyl-CoA synthetase
MEIDTNSTVYNALFAAAQQHPAKDAVVFGGTRKTYKQLINSVDSLAEGLYDLGIRKGDNVALILPPCFENVLCFFSLAKLGTPFVPISPQLRSYEVQHILRDSDSVAVIAMAEMMGHNYLQMIEDIRPHLPKFNHLIALGKNTCENVQSFDALVENENKTNLEEPVFPSDIVGIFYTSGTTGLPKGAMHSHRGILTQISSTIELFSQNDLAAMLNFFPMFHLSGIVSPLIFLLSGGKLVLTPRFDPREALRLIEEEKISFMVGAPITARIILKLAESSQRDLSSLRIFGMGGAQCPPEIIHNLKQRFNCGVFNGLGITEAGFVSASKPDDPEDKQVATVGRPPTGVDLEIVNDDRQILPVGDIGEIACRSSMMMEGYYKQPDETSKVLDDDGWYYTGDIGRLDQLGYLTILDRKKDVISRGAENIYPAEIERYLVSHSKIKKAAVIGVPSAVGGERVRAYILAEDGAELDEIEVVKYCRGQIASYKLPDEVRFVDDFPLSSLWKVQKYKLREEASTEE